MNENINLIKIMKAIGVSAEELSNSLNVRYCDMAKILNGKENVPDSLIIKLYRVYGAKIFD